MAPQASTSVVLAPTAQSSVFLQPAHTNGGHKPYIPVALLVFLGLCLAYTFSYVLYRIIMARRLRSEDNIPDAPDRGVSQFMNGARLTLNFGNSRRSSPVILSESPNVHDEEKPLRSSQRAARSDVPARSPAESSSTPFTALVPSFTIHANQELGDMRLQGEQGPTIETPLSTPALTPASTTTHPPLAQRVAAKVKLLSRDRAEAIALDPKLAPVQGPLRPLSIIPSPPHKKRTTLFGLGLKHVRVHGSETDTGLLQAR